NNNRSAGRCAEVALLINGARPREKAACIKSIVAQKLISSAMEFVRARFRYKCDDSAARLAILRFETVRVDGELGDGFNRWRHVSGLARIRRAVRIDREAIERGSPTCRLASAQRKSVAAPFRFR